MPAIADKKCGAILEAPKQIHDGTAPAVRFRNDPIARLQDEATHAGTLGRARIARSHYNFQG
ncbi:MAG: hypothetical protein ACREQD_16580, partial [Candidatus Binataceae bacterium]